MEFLLLILLGAVAVFYAQLRRMAERIGLLEEEVGRLRSEPIAAEPTGRSSAASAPPARLGQGRWSDMIGAVPAPAEAFGDDEDAQPARTGDHEAETVGTLRAAAPDGDGGAEGDGLGGMFERFVGGRLLIWVGGVALAVAGLLLVRYSIELGLITPPVRMLMAAGFGLLLVGAGEAARWRPGLTPDERIPQALVGAGILVLYAAAYGSLILYGLISLGTCFALMALITAAALALSLRHGVPTAVMGLIGGFLTPLLVGEPGRSVVPLLAYLALLDLALLAVAQRRGWTLLAAAAALLSFLWTLGYMFAPRIDDALATGAFVVALAMAASLVRPGQGRQLSMIQPAAIGLLQIAILVVRTDIGVPAWALFGLMSLACLALAVLRAEYRLLPPFAFALALLLLAIKAFDGSDPALPAVAAAIAILFGGFAWWRFEPRPVASLMGAAAVAGPALVLRGGEPHLLPEAGWGVALSAAALGPALLAWRQRRHADAGLVDVPLLAAGAGAALLLISAAPDLVPWDRLGSAWLAVALLGAFAARRLEDKGLGLLAVLVAALGFLAGWASVPTLWAAVVRSLTGAVAVVDGLSTPAEALLGIGLPALLLAACARLLPDFLRIARAGLAAAAGLFAAAVAWVLFKQIFAIADGDDFAARGFAERTVLTQLLFAAGWLLAGERVRLPGFRDAQPLIATALTAAAAARLVWFDLLLHNPVLVGQHVGTIPLINLLLPAYFGSALWLYAARRRAIRRGAPGGWMALFLIALIAGTMLMVRQAFQGSLLAGFTMSRAEFYGYSLAGLALAIALLTAGIRLPDKAVRVAGLALLAATTIKVFLVDADALEGVLRILSFLGLGVALIAIGKMYGTVLRAERPARG